MLEISYEPLGLTFATLITALVRKLAIFVVILATFGVGCGDNSAAAGTGIGGEGAACFDDSVCRAGLNCIDGVCVSLDGGTVDKPLGGPAQITVEPTEVDFGSPLIGSETAATVTISNVGGSTLIIPAIDVIESEDASLPQEIGLSDLTLPILIEPGRSREIEVTLRPQDGIADTGYLIIANNDPDQADSLKRVDLTSDVKGNPVFEVCVPESFPPPGDCTLLDRIDFGFVPIGASSTRVFSVRNLGDGNRPIVISDVGISNGNSHFLIDQACDDGSCDLFEWDAETETELPLEGLPALLRPGDAKSDIAALREPNRLYVRVTFVPLAPPPVDGLVPPERVQLETDLEDPADGDDTFEVPMVGVIVGCRPGFVDADGDPENGCEYECTPSGDDEEDCDGVDDDCDTLEDENYVPFDCGIGACESLSTCVGGVEDCIERAPDNDDDCDGSDDDCDGTPDDNWVAHSCGVGSCLAMATCEGGVEGCEPAAAGVETCSGGTGGGADEDCDGLVDEDDPGDAFEGGANCPAAVGIGSVSDSGAESLLVSGVIHNGDDDWYAVVAVDDPVDSCFASGDEFDFRICWVENPGNDLRVDVHRGSCPPAASSCTSVADVAQWDFTCPDASDCCSGAGASGSDFGATYTIRVYRAPGEPVDCASYTLKIANGAASCP